MLVFLDTEFTDLLDCDLISVGMVSLDGQHSLYLERSDYRADWCSPFVQAAVLPQLGHVAAVDRAELADRLAAWFASLPPGVVVACDNRTDWELLLDALGDHHPANLTGCYDLRETMSIAGFNHAAARYHEHAPWHHALHDAQAHRHGWIAVRDLVPVHTREGRPHRVALRDIPEPWRTQFTEALRGSACPVDDALGPCAFAWDWMKWTKGDHYAHLQDHPTA